MLKLSEIKSFSKAVEEINQDFLHDSNAVSLESAGHTVICIDRAIATIEQCESISECVDGKSKDAVKLTVYPDKDLAPTDCPHEIFITANRWGSSEVFLKIGDRVLKALWVEDKT